MDEKELIEKGWVREMSAIHISEYDPHQISEDKTVPFRRLSYDLSDTFTGDQISALQGFVQEVNRRFPNIKMFMTGTGIVPGPVLKIDIQDE